MDKYDLPFVRTFEYTQLIGIENIRFGKYVIIDDFVVFYAKRAGITIGDYCHFAVFSSITGGGEATVGNFSGLSPGARIITGSEDFKEGFGAGPAIDERFRNVHRGKVVLHDFSMVGSNCIILPDVEIGEGTTVIAGTTVSKSLDPWSIYHGNRKIGEKDRDLILKKYEEFLKIPEKDRVGSLFKKEF